MERCDVLIVGGGPAGSSCAARLREAGLDVIVLDKRAFPRDKTCAGWVTPAVVQALRLDLHDYQRDHVLQPFTGFRVGLMGSRGVEIDYGYPVSYGIRRCEFDDYLLRRSCVRLGLGEACKTIVRADGSWVVNGGYQAAMLIGAGGHFCPVARLLDGGRNGPERIVAAQEIEFEMDTAQARACPIQPEVPELFFCEDLEGYGWCVRKGNYLNIGLGREDNRGLSQHVRGFVHELQRTGRVPWDISERFNGHAYILYGHSQRQLSGEGVLLIGDAAGLAYPRSGEGIRTAVESGLLAAQIVVAADGDYRQERLGSYEALLRQRFGKPGETKGLSTRLPGRFKTFIAARFLANPWLSRHIVLNRWFLHRQQPALV